MTEHERELEKQFAIVVERNEVLERELGLIKNQIEEVLPRAI